MVREADTALAVRVLGAVEVVGRAADGSQPIAVGGKTQRRILALLLAARPDVLSIDRLVDATWNGEPPARAEHNVRTYISRLRSALGDALHFEQVGDGYRLELVDAAADVDRFQQLLDGAERLREGGSVVDGLAAVRRALALWQGRPFGEFADEEWARPLAARLEARHERADELHVELLLANGLTDDAIGYLDTLVTTHPLREQPRALLMRALYTAGRTTEALRSFQDFRNRLRDDVGLDPSKDLVELDRAIARGELVDRSITVRIGGYQLHERIGSGAFAVVHRATQTSLGREVAIKIIRSELATQPAFVRGFEREARMVASLEHDAIMPLYDFWRDPDQAYLVMRFLPGGTLADKIEAGPLPLGDVTSLVDRIGGALSAAHDGGIVHCDVKPTNIVFDADGRAVLGDFGIALQNATTDGVVPSVTASPSSARHAAPEQLRGSTVTPASDIYSLASVVRDAITGSPLLGPTIPAPLAALLEQATDPDPMVRPDSVSTFISRFHAALGETTPRRASGEPPINPYRGLLPFEEASSEHFHGRAALVDELVTVMSDPACRLLAVIGASGSGKSSVVRAGLLPMLRHDAVPGSSTWFVTAMTPGPHPFEALETALLRVAVNPPGELLSQLTDGDRGVHRSIDRLLPESDGELLLVIDQFEELFTNGDPAATTHFLDAISVALTEPTTRLRIVLTLRADFHDRPLQHPRFAPVLTTGSVAVTPLSPEELEAVIVEPARAVGVDFETGLVARIMADTTRQPGSLPLLEYALTQAFERSDGQRIIADDYDSLGGIDGALVQRAEELHDQLDNRSRVALRSVMGQLVSLGEGTEDTRRRAQRSELGSSSAIDEVVDRFGHARLFTFDHDPASREPTVEVAHETLIRSWPRLRSWLDEDRDDLRLARHLAGTAKEWEQTGRPDSELYRGGRLEAAREWRDRETPILPGEQVAFLDASIAQAEAEEAADQERFETERRTSHRLRRLLAGVAVLLALAMVAGGVAFQQRRTARQTAFDAETGRLVATAQLLAEVDPRAALLVAVAANEREQSPATLGALQVALSSTSTANPVLNRGTPYVDVEWLSNGLIAGVRVDGVDLIDPDTGETVDSVELAVGAEIFAGPFEGDPAASAMTRATLAVVTEAPSVVVFDVTTTLDVRFELSGSSQYSSVVVRPDGGAVATADVNNLIVIYDDSGSIVHRTDLDDSENIFEQARPIVGDNPLYKDFLLEFGTWSKFFEDPTELVIGTGGYLRRFDWTGNELADPIFLTGDFGGGLVSVDGARTVVLGDDGPRLITSASKVWTPDTAKSPQFAGSGAELQPIPELIGGGLADIMGVRATATGDVFLLSDGTIARIEPATRVVDRVLSSGSPAASSFDVDPPASSAAVATPDGVVIVELRPTPAIADHVSRPIVSANLSIASTGDVAVAGGAGGPAPTIIFRRSGVAAWTTEERLFRPPADMFAQIPPDEDDKFSVTGTALVPVIFDATADEMVEVVEIQPVEAASTAGDTSRILSLAAFGLFDVQLHRYSDGTLLRRIKPPDGMGPIELLSALRFDPTSERLLAASESGRFDIWSTDDWTRLDLGSRADDDIVVGHWNREGTLFASASSTGAITIRDGDTLEPIRTMIGAVGTENTFNDGALLFSPDDRYLLTNFADRSARLWDVESGQQIGRPFESAPGTNSGVNVGEHFQLITGTEDGALIWNLDFDAWPEIACNVAGSNLTEDEWNQWGPRDEPFRELCQSAA